jgi:imidazolonepropionase-like amidohydrolase
LLLWATWATAQPLVLKTSTILDGKGHVLRNKDIVIEDGRIVRISDATEKASYDLSGLTVMPGWIDTHVHFAVHFDSNNRVEGGGAGSKEAPDLSA